MKLKIEVVLAVIVIFFAFQLGARLANKVTSVLPKVKPTTYQMKATPKVDTGMQLEVQRFAIETVNKRGDKKIPNLTGTITATKDIKKGTVTEVNIKTSPDLIKAPYKRCSVVAMAYPSQVYPGLSYELITLGDITTAFKLKANPSFYDYSFDVGITGRSPFMAVAKTFNPSVKGFIGSGYEPSGTVCIFGVGVRF